MCKHLPQEKFKEISSDKIAYWVRRNVECAASDYRGVEMYRISCTRTATSISAAGVWPDRDRYQLKVHIGSRSTI